MKIQEVKIDMVVEVTSGVPGFYKGETFMVKGIVYAKGAYYILPEPLAEDLIVKKAVLVDEIEPVKTEIDKITDSIKKEIGEA
jgi:hypothetical protein